MNLELISSYKSLRNISRVIKKLKKKYFFYIYQSYFVLSFIANIHPGQQTQKNEIGVEMGLKSEDGVREFFNISHHDPYFIRKDLVEIIPAGVKNN